MINASNSKLHWNYFIALERDLDAMSRYIEFTTDNFEVYSIELAHLLFAAASEVDVVAKLLCEQVAPEAKRDNIHHYRDTLMPSLPELATMQVSVARHGLVMTPWDNWGTGTNPLWWGSYNKVKHERHSHFNQATLKNALNSLSALLVLNYEYYRHDIIAHTGDEPEPYHVTNTLKPDSTLLRLVGPYYSQYLKARPS